MAQHRIWWMQLLLRVLLFLSSLAATTSSTLTISINGSGGNDSECPGREGEVPCTTLVRASELLQEFGGVKQVQIQTNLTLKHEIKISNASSFEIVGSDLSPYNLTYVRCETGGVGLVLDNVHNFSILNVALVKCTANFSENHRVYRSAMMIKSSSNFILKNVRFENCSTTALVLINNTRQVTLENTSFVQYHTKHRKFNVQVLSYPGALSIQQNLGSNQEGIHVRISDSIFHHNQSPQTNFQVASSSARYHTNFLDRGYGGAVFIEFGGETSHSSLVVENSIFTSNIAARGGAVYAYYKNHARNNSIRMLSIKFIKNSADVSGGALNLGCSSPPSAMNVFEVRSCEFINNSALFGAGLAIFFVYGHQVFSSTNTFTINNSTWWGNSGVLSSAVDVGPLNNRIGERGYLPVPRFINCTFESNIIQEKMGVTLGKTRHNNVGVFLVALITVSFSGNTTFRNNSFSAILLDTGIAEFEANSTVLFEGNTGFNGGAVAMYGYSTILFNIYSDINFSRNHAINYGGAIFYKTSDQHTFLAGSNHCFLQNKLSTANYSLVGTIKVSFENNTADVGGAAMYSESFYSCYVRCREFMRVVQPKIHYNFKYSNVYLCVGKFTYVNTGKEHPLLSSGKIFQFKEKSNFSYSVFPGSSLRLPFTVYDDFNTTVTPLLSITKLGQTSEIDVSNRYTLSNRTVPVGKPNASSKFTITAISVREIYFRFEVTLLPCPPGYHIIENNTCACASGNLGYREIVKCDNSKFHAIYRGDYYVGYIPSESTDHNDLYFAPCVSPLCRNDNHHLPETRAHLTRLICAQHRQGVMCGECQDNFTTFYHSRNFKCGPILQCHLGFLFYVLSEILPMVVFLTVVVTFDLSFTSGISVGFIFFTQYLNQLTIHVSTTFSSLRAPYRLFYGLFNFEFLHLEELSFCLWTNAQVLDVLAVKYITVLIAFGLVLAFTATLQNNSCSKLCRLRKKVSAKTSVVHGLSAFLVTCYAQCTRTSFYILRYTEPIGYNGRHIGYYSYYGGLPYFKGQHLIYAIPALISLVFVTILPPLVLLLYPLSLQLLSLCGLSEHWIVNKTLQLTGINKLKPFIDCFQSCYKDKFRFFAGLYFVYRITILLTFTISANSVLFNVYSAIVIVLWLGIHSTVQPYKERLHNTIDSLVFFNLALINGCVVIAKEWAALVEDPNLIATGTRMLLLNIIQLLLLYAPMVAVLAYLVWLGCAYIRRKSRSTGMTGGFIEVEDILEHDSDHSHLLTRSDGSEESSSRTGNYGSTLDTY